LIAICVSNCSTGDLSESQDNSTASGSNINGSDNDNGSDSDNGSETENELDDGPAQKKQKTDNSRHSRKGKSLPVGKNE
jgi:hypothetical protein